LLAARIVALAVCLLSGVAGAEPVPIQLVEGVSRGFLVLRDVSAATIAQGEQIQKPIGGGRVWNRLVLKFRDGSLFDEQLTFSQQKVFRLERYHLVQRGPALPAADISFDRASGRFQARTQDKPGGEEKQASGRLEMPADLSNGMAATLLKSLSAGAGATVHVAAFTPEPRLVRMVIAREGEDRVRVGGGEAKTALRYLVKFEIGGLAGAIAPLLGKAPPDLRYWIVAGEVPAFARFEGAMFVSGPVWRLEQAPLEWIGEPSR
jgi:hypothetical protein